MNHINQFITRTNTRKFEETQIEVHNPMPNVFVAIKHAYNTMNEFFGLEGNIGAQAIYYGMFIWSALVVILLRIAVNSMG